MNSTFPNTYFTWRCINCDSLFSYAMRKLDGIFNRQSIYCPKCKCKTIHTKLTGLNHGQTISK